MKTSISTRVKLLLLFLFFNLNLYSKPHSIYDNIHVLPETLAGGWNWDKQEKILEKIIEENQINVNSIIEIGSYVGYSTIGLAKFCSETGVVIAIDSWQDPEFYQSYSEGFQCNPYYFQQFLSNIIHTNLQNIVIPFKMSSHEAYQMISTQADIIYIDGDHSFNGVLSDMLNFWFLLKEGGIMCGDDFHFKSVGDAVKEYCRRNGLTLFFEDTFWWVFKNPRV